MSEKPSSEAGVERDQDKNGKMRGKMLDFATHERLKS
jgi:hypothetical protein